MKKMMITSALVLTSLIASPAFSAGDPAAGKAKAAACVACHGMNGIGTTDLYPNLAGQKEAYLASQYKAFQSGARQNAIMGPMAQILRSEQDIADVSAYYASLK